MEFATMWRGVIATLVFGALGIAMFALAIKLMTKLAPFSVEKEIAEDHNTALAIVMGSVLIGLSIILAAALHG